MSDTSSDTGSDISSYMQTGPTGWQWAALIVGNVALALGPWSVRVADSGPVSAGFWRLLLALPFLYLLARMNGEQVFAIPRKAAILVTIAGVAFALDLTSWHIGIAQTRLGNATLFGNSGSLVLLVWGFVIGQMWPGRRETLAIMAALGGVAILMGRSLEISQATLIGDLFSLLAGLFYAVYLLVLHDARKSLGSFALLAWVCAAGAPIMLAFALVLGEPVWPQDWTPIIALFIGSQLIGQGLVVYALRHFTPLVIGLALLMQPVVAAMYGWIRFSEVLSVLDMVGMALLGIALVIAKTRTA